MNLLSIFLYLADILPKLSILFGVSAVLALLLSIPLLIAGNAKWEVYLNDTLQEVNVRRAKVATFGSRALKMAFVCGLLSAAIPSSQTMYMIAGSEIGEVMITSEDGKEIYEEIKDTILTNLRTLKNERSPVSN